MEDKTNIKYIPEYNHEMYGWYKMHTIGKEKTDLFHDILNGVFLLLEETYMGFDVLSEESDQKKHFKWCWNKIIDNLNKEKIYLKRKGIHYEYFWNFFQITYYTPKSTDDVIKIPLYFSELFNYEHIKNESEFIVFLELYKLLEKNLTK